MYNSNDRNEFQGSSYSLSAAPEDKLRCVNTEIPLLICQRYLTHVFVFSFMNEKSENGPRRVFRDKENPTGTLK